MWFLINKKLFFQKIFLKSFFTGNFGWNIGRDSYVTNFWVTDKLQYTDHLNEYNKLDKNVVTTVTLIDRNIVKQLQKNSKADKDSEEDRIAKVPRFMEDQLMLNKIHILFRAKSSVENHSDSTDDLENFF